MKKEKPVKKKKEPIIFEGVQYDSEFEVLFQQWIKECLKYGYISDAIYHPKPFVLCESTTREYLVEGKKKVITKTHAMFKKIIYTADWWIYWTQKAIDSGLVGDLKGNKHINDFPLMFQTDDWNRHYTVIDVKPPVKMGGHNASYRDLGIKAPLIWDMYGIYIQSIVPVNSKKPEDCFFSKTWAPKVYLERDRKDGKGYLISYCRNFNIDDYEKNFNKMDER